MPRPAKGQRTPGSGRQPGTPNKATQDLLLICEQEGVEPFRAMVIAAKQIDEPKSRCDAFEKVSQYVYPKRKAIEHSGGMDTGIAAQMERFSRMSDAELDAYIKQEAMKLAK